MRRSAASTQLVSSLPAAMSRKVCASASAFLRAASRMAAASSKGTHSTRAGVHLPAAPRRLAARAAGDGGRWGRRWTSASRVRCSEGRLPVAGGCGGWTLFVRLASLQREEVMRRAKFLCPSSIDRANRQFVLTASLTIGILWWSVTVFEAGAPTSEWPREGRLEAGRYRQADPAGSAGGLNRYLYAGADGMLNVDPQGLWWMPTHRDQSALAGIAAGMPGAWSLDLGRRVAGVDKAPHSQDPENSAWHAMRPPSWTDARVQEYYKAYVEARLGNCTKEALADALHAIQDSYSPSHLELQPWEGTPGRDVPLADWLRRWLEIVHHGAQEAPVAGNLPQLARATIASRNAIQQWMNNCSCRR